MSNEYYPRSNSFTKGTHAKGGDVKAELDAIVTGFDLIPTTADFSTGLVTYQEATGTANTYAITMSNVTAYASGISVLVKIPVNNTGASTINVNGLGAVAIKRADLNNVEAGDLRAGGVTQLVHDGTQFVIVSSDPNLVAQSEAAATEAETQKDLATDEALNASSWANEDEDVPVKEYTGGVGSNRSPVTYSAKHWKLKAEAISPATKANLVSPVVAGNLAGLDALGDLTDSGISGSDVAFLSSLTADKAIVTNGSGNIVDSTASSTQVSYLSNVTSDIQTQINSIQTQLNNTREFDPGTALVFYMNSAPTGWVTQAINDRMLYVVSSGGGTTAGTDSPIAAHTHTTNSHILTTNEMPSHYHQENANAWMNASGSNGVPAGTGYFLNTVSTGRSSAYYTGSEGNNASHSHGATGSSFAPKYATVVIGVKS